MQREINKALAQVREIGKHLSTEQYMIYLREVAWEIVQEQDKMEFTGETEDYD